MSITVRSNVSQAKLLEMQLRDVISKMGQTWAVALDGTNSRRTPYPTLRPRKGAAPAQPTNAQVLQYLEGNGRPVTSIPEAMRVRAMAFAMSRFRGKAIPLPQNVMMALAPFIKETFVQRVLHNGADISGQIPTNSAKWTRYKRKLGLSTNKLKASGQLAAWLQSARFRIVRVK